jgi:hypothetical protein
VTGLERDLVADCRRSAEAMNAFLAVVQQHVAKKSGTTRGFPDLVLICAGKVVLIEVKRPKTAEHPRGYLSLGQSAFIARAAEMGVQVEVIDSVEDFEALVNSCRRRVRAAS